MSDALSDNDFVRLRAIDYQQKRPDDHHVGHITNQPGVRIYELSADQIEQHLPKGSKVLDWGCGYGHLTYLTSRRGYDVHGWESFSEPPIPAFFENATYRQIHPGVPLPTDEKFDAVLSSGTLEHVADLHRSMQELIGVLRPGGMVFIFRFPAQLSLSEYVARRSGRWSHAVRLRRRELEVLLQTHGVRIIESGYETFLPVALAGRSAKAQRLRQRLSVVAEASDRALTAMPVVRAFSTSMYCIGAQNAEYDSTTVERNLAPTDNRSKTATNAS